MTDVLPPDDSLHDAISVLRTPVPIVSGLDERVARTRRRHERRLRTGFVSLVAVALVIGVLTLRPFTGSGAAVTFALDAPQVHSVSLVGDFTDWQPDRVRLTPSRDGRWEVTLRLQPGRYRFAYVVNDRDWRPDSHAATVPDDFGRPTSILTVAAR